ncbi:MAG: hypothetical protein ABSC94_13085 [Polyangiaceae bacterium]|jgi:hypothetical protein
MRSQHHLDVLDTLLARERPFGDSDYVHEQLQVRYKRRLGQVAALLPVAGELSRALDQANSVRRYRVIGDPVVRYAVHQALRQVVKGSQDGLPLDDCEGVFRETLRYLDERKIGGPTEAGLSNVRRLGTESFHGWTWSEEHPDDVFGRSFRKIVRDNFQGEPLCVPSADDLAKLAKGAELLAALMPLTSRSALSHAHVVVVVPHVGRWMQKGSCSEFRVGGAIFLNRDMLKNPWWVAEHLFHESLHQKLYDFRQAHSLLAQDIAPPTSEDSAAVCAIWNVGGSNRSNAWDTFRVIAAFHVYVHLAVLCLQADRRKSDLVKRFGAPDASFPTMTSRREAFERSHYLGRKLKESCWHELGPAGRLLVDWLMSIMKTIDPLPPPTETVYLHLLLNRYIVEAVMLSEKKLSPEVAAPLTALVDDEAETVRSVLSALGDGRPQIERLGEGLPRRADESAEAHLLRFRTLIAKILQAQSPDGYGLRRPPTTESLALDKTIEAMIERSSQRLASALAAPRDSREDPTPRASTDQPRRGSSEETPPGSTAASSDVAAPT